MRSASIEERVRDYIEAERVQVPVPARLAPRIPHAIDATRPAPRHSSFAFVPVAAAIVVLLFLAIGVAWVRTAHMPASVESGTWSPAPAMPVGRGFHTATLLPNGKLLVVGGNQTFRALPASAELYDPGTRMWSSAGMLSTPRSLHTATLLKNGKVLVGGGSQVDSFSLGSLASAELYDPQTNSWALAANMHTPRSYHTATLLADGRVLVVGGIEASNDVTGKVLATAELYDPDTNTWTTAAPMRAARARHAAILLADQRVLVIGGNDVAYSAFSNYFATAELYDPSRQSWSPAGSMNYARTFATATVLPDGRVLVVGDAGVNERTAEIFDPRNERWSLAPAPGVARAEHVAVRLRNGAVLVAGGIGETSAELFDWSRNAWSNAGAMAVIRADATATVLDNGQVLVTGGFGSGRTAWASAERYDPLGSHVARVARATSTALSAGWVAPLLAVIAALLALGLWSTGRRRDRRSREGVAWVD